MRKKLAIIVIILALLFVGASIAGVVVAGPGAAPAGQVEPTATAIATVVQSVDVVTYSGHSACPFTVTPPAAGWQLLYGFVTPGTTGTVSSGDSVLDTQEVVVNQTRPRGTIALDAGVRRRFKIEVTGGGLWHYTVRPPDGTPGNATTITEPPDGSSAGALQNFRLQACRG